MRSSFLFGSLAVLSIAFCASFTIVYALADLDSPTGQSTPEVDTPVGRFVGVRQTNQMDGKDFISYRSIPFARPPVGELRFQRPQPPLLDVGKRYANSKNYKKSCLSITKEKPLPYYGEDCLYLNVYVPGVDPPGDDDSPYAVMVWIHGGGFVAGSTFPEPAKLVTAGKVIVVSVNFRLGPLGFLTTGDDELPSNNGLWDQYMAMTWVKNYIKYFHGDETSITLFGSSSGGISVGLHTVSSVSSHLFHKAVLQSGTLPFTYYDDAPFRARRFADSVGCSFSNSSVLANCLRQLNETDILNNDHILPYDMSSGQRQADFLWGPVIDGHFIVDNPVRLYANASYLNSVGAFQKKYMVGVVNNEGALVIDNFLNPVNLYEASNSTFFDDLSTYLLQQRYGESLTDENMNKLHEAARFFYTGTSGRETLHSQNTLDLAGDLMFVLPAITTSLALSSRHTVCDGDIHAQVPTSATKDAHDCTELQPNTTLFFYHFDFCPDADEGQPRCMVHADDFQLEFPKTNFSDPALQKLSDMYVDLLTSFAKTSHPSSSLAPYWPTYEPDDRRYLRILPHPDIRQYLYDYRMKFWMNTGENKVKQK